MADQATKTAKPTGREAQIPSAPNTPSSNTPRARQLKEIEAHKAAQDRMEAELQKGAMNSAPRTKSPKRPTNKPAAGPARARRRHIKMLAIFFQIVILPTFLAGWYLYVIAQDQYASNIGFSVRKEETGSAVEILGGITELSGSSSNDTDILYEFIQSQNLVRAVSDKINLTNMFTREMDPIFSLGEDTRIEAMTRYWNRMVDVTYDRSSGLIGIRVRAFDPQDAHTIATLIYSESSRMINTLSDVARSDATRYAAQELEEAVERLKLARTQTTAFRTRTQIVDPVADIQGRMGLLNTLNAQLADALIELDLTRQASARDDDQRVVQGERRVTVIEDRIQSERRRFSQGEGGTEDQAYSQLVGEYEALSVDLRFAEEAYVVALATLNSATADAQRQSRYLASYLEPTIAETPEYPQRIIILTTLFGTLLMAFSIMTMIYYSLRDRR